MTDRDLSTSAPPEVEALIASPTDTLVVGMSGIGKSWLTSRMSSKGQWRRIIIDAEIQSRYLEAELKATFQSEIAACPMLARMVSMGAMTLDLERYAESLVPLTAWLGMPGNPERGGIAFKEHKRRQRAHYKAERRALEDLLSMEHDPEKPLLVDTSGSFCEVLSVADPLFSRLVARFRIVSIRESDALVEILISRFQECPKPIFYPHEVLECFWQAFLAETGTSEHGVVPTDFAQWAYERLVDLRRAKYAKIADATGIAIDAEKFQNS